MSKAATPTLQQRASPTLQQPQIQVREKPDELTPYEEEYEKRVRENRDFITVIDSYTNARGEGKTVLSLLLSNKQDRTNQGLTLEKAGFDPEALRENYTDQPKGAALVLEESANSLSKYMAGSKVNQAVRDVVNMGRVEEKYVTLNLPNYALLDTDLFALCDYWISVTGRGTAIVHKIDYNKYRQKVQTPIVQTLTWTDLYDEDLLDIYVSLTKEKRERLRGKDGDGFIKASEVDERVQKEREQARMEQRNDLICNLYDEMDMTQTEVANHFDMTQVQVSRIIKERA